MPLLILIPINSCYGNIGFYDLLATSNFSFVVVVLNAIVLSNFIELKSKVQEDQSYKILEGVKLYSILLIAACIVLTMSLLNEYKVITKSVDTNSLIVINLVLFALGLISLYLKTFLEIGRIEYYTEVTELGIDKKELAWLLLRKSEDINNEILSLIAVCNEFKLEQNKKENMRKPDKKIESTILEFEGFIHKNQALLNVLNDTYQIRRNEIIG